MSNSNEAVDTGLEQYGVDTIPDSARTSSPRYVIAILWGGNMALSVGVFGWLSILYGLSWWASVSAIVVGTAVGALVVTPLALLGFRAATNNSVSSGAYFGVRGRLVASVIGLLLCLGYVALTIWTGGEALVAVTDRLLGTEESVLQDVLGYGLLAVAIAVVAIYGYRWLLRVNTIIVIVVGAAMLLSVIGLADKFDATYPGSPDLYALGSFWPTWLLAALTAGIAGPLSYVTQLGDWTRYISPRRHKPGTLLIGMFVGLLGGLLIPTLWGAYVSSILFDENSFPAGLVTGVPSWLLIPVVLAALVGSIGQGAMNLYSMGLDLDAILPRLTRMQATIVMTVVSTVLVFLGKFIWDAEVAVTSFVVFLTSLATPWAAITLIGLWRTRGSFDQPDLQVFNQRRTGGRYWYSGGWNAAAVLAWITGSVVGILSNATDSYTGPIAVALGGVDASFITSGVAAAVVYLLLITVRPQWLHTAEPVAQA
ncbi:MAG TPA: cytosine permease [Mycobacterium sp.]|nr:cytosine permease [Mycobacterium sp.]HQC76157.1 cytosine permease [Mycobacterium sp.]